MAEAFREMDGPAIAVKGFGEKEAAGVFSVVKDFVCAYREKAPEQDKLDWLSGQMKRYLLDELDDAQLSGMSREIVDSIDAFNADMDDLRTSQQGGQSREEWMQEKLMEDAPGDTMQQKGEYLQGVLDALTSGNALLTEAAQQPENCEIELRTDIPAEQEEQQEWNSYTVRELALKIAQQAELTSAAGVSMGGSLTAVQAIRDVAGKIVGSEKEPHEDIFDKLTNGLQVAGAGALAVCVRKGKIPFLDRTTDVQLLTNTACTGIETMKAAYHFMKGRISASQAVDYLAGAASVSVKTLCQKGISAVAMRVHPLAAAVAGSSMGQAVISVLSEGVARVAAEGIKALKPIAEPVLETAREIAEMAQNTVKSVAGFVKSFL